MAAAAPSRVKAALLLAFLAGVASARRTGVLEAAESALRSPEASPGRSALPRHLSELAARGEDLQAWQEVVMANARDVPSFMEEHAAALEKAGHEAGAAPGWPWKQLDREGTVVGKGAFGKVYVGSVACDGSVVAVKEMRTTEKEVDAEASALKLFTHGPGASPHFISYFDHKEGKKGVWYIMMEAALGKTLANIIDGSKPASRSDKGQLFLDLLEGINEMHARNIIHRDLKPANVMISRTCGGSTSCHAKVGDLGLACWTGKSVQGVPSCAGLGVGGTPLYIAPETYRSGIVHSKNDIWALGLMLYELEFGEPPDAIGRSSSLESLQRNIERFQISADHKYGGLKAGTLKTLIGGLLENNHNTRSTAAEALVLARSLVPQSTRDELGSLPPCYYSLQEKDPKPHSPAEQVTTGEQVVAPARWNHAMQVTQDHQEAAGLSRENQVDWFTLVSPKTVSGANFLFNGKIVDEKSGVVLAETKKLKELKTKGYFKSPLQKGDVVLAVNDQTWSAITSSKKAQLQQGVFGDLVVKYVR